jgi:tetratricopeptide (TPR) repeat protein
VLQQARYSQDPRLEAAALDEAGRNALDQEKWQDAREYFEQALPAAAGPDSSARRASILASLAIALIGEGRVSDAAKCLVDDESGASDEPDVAARWTRARSLLRYRMGERQGSLDSLRGLVDRLGSSGFELERARTLLLLGRLLVESRERDEALAVLEQARVLFDRRKAKALLARTLLTKARARIA